MIQNYSVPKYNIKLLEQILDSQSKINQTHTMNFIQYLCYAYCNNDMSEVHISSEQIIKNQSHKWYANEFKKLLDASIVLTDGSYKVGRTTKSYKVNDKNGFSTLDVDVNEKTFIKTFKNDYTINDECINAHKKFISQLNYSLIDLQTDDSLKKVLEQTAIKRMKRNNYNITVKNHRLYSPFTQLSKETKKQFGIFEVDIKSCQPQVLASLFDSTIPLDEQLKYKQALHNDIYTVLIPNSNRKQQQKHWMKLLNSKNSSITEQISDNVFEWQPLYYVFKREFPNILKFIKTIKKTNKMYDVTIKVERDVIQGTVEELYEQDIIVGSNHDAIYCNIKDITTLKQILVTKMKQNKMEGLI